LAISNPLTNKKVLITCGPTWVPIDDMRVISNRSTGTLGQEMAKRFARSKAKVTLLEGPVKAPLRSGTVKVIKFAFYNELVNALKCELEKGYDIVIHAAAVSDYKVKGVSRTKISSDKKELPLTLVPTKKIINSIKRICPKAFLVGFKLESKVAPVIARQKSIKLFEKGKCDLVLVNSSKNSKYSAYIVDRIGNILACAQSRKNIIQQLIKILRKKL